MPNGRSRSSDLALGDLVASTMAFYRQRAPRNGPRTAQELSAARAATPAPPPSVPPPSTEMARHGGRTVPVRIHTPTTTPRGVLLEIHGGGFFMGSAAQSDARNRARADALGVVVVSVDYRLAPEHPWPAAPDDGETAALWLVEQAAERFGTSRLAVVGFSAGSTLAATTLVRLRDRGVSAFCGAVLQFGTYDLSGRTPGGRLFADEYFIEAYAGHVDDRTAPDVSPIFAELAGLPPTLMIVGEDDVLLRDNLAMAARLKDAGVDVDLRVYPAAPHGFTAHATPMASAALDDVHAWLDTRLGADGR